MFFVAVCEKDMAENIFFSETGRPGEVPDMHIEEGRGAGVYPAQKLFGDIPFWETESHGALETEHTRAWGRNMALLCRGYPREVCRRDREC